MNDNRSGAQPVRSLSIAELPAALSAPTEVVLVDFGGVLAHYVPNEVCRAIEAEFGISQGLARWLFDHPASWEGLVGRKTPDEVLHALAQQDGLPLARVRDIWSAFRSANILDRALIDELQRHRPRVRVFVLSNYWSNGRQVLLDMLPQDTVDGVFISAELGMKKLDSALWDHLIGSLARPAGAIMLLDDEEQNVASAMRAGLAAYLWIKR